MDTVREVQWGWGCMKPKPNTDWLAALESVINGSMERPGPEWKTGATLRKELGIGHSAMARKLRLLIKADRVEVKRFTIMLNKMHRPTPHYRLK